MDRSRTLAKAIRLTAAFIAFSVVMASPAPVAAEDLGCGSQSPSSVDMVRGYTWSGTVTDVQVIEQSEYGAERRLNLFDVDAVYAHVHGSEFRVESVLAPGREFAMPSHSCNGLAELMEGRRYLISASLIEVSGPEAYRTAVWEIEPDGRSVSLAPYESHRRLAGRLLEVQDLREAVELVAPGAELPPTDAGMMDQPTRSTGGLELLFPLLAVFIGLLFRSRLRAQVSRDIVRP